MLHTYPLLPQCPLRFQLKTAYPRPLTGPLQRLTPCKSYPGGVLTGWLDPCMVDTSWLPLVPSPSGAPGLTHRECPSVMRRSSLATGRHLYLLPPTAYDVYYCCVHLFIGVVLFLYNEALHTA